MRTAGFFTSLGERLRDERGIALVTALGVLFVLSLALVSIISYTSANSRTSAHGRSKQQAHALAEAGVNNALAVLYNADDPSDPLLLPDGSAERPAHSQEYEGGRVEWHAEVVDTGEKWEWQIASNGFVENPTGPGAADVRETLRGTARLYLPTSNELTADMWNWLYSGGTGTDCDMTIDQPVDIDARLYVVGNLCMRNTATVAAGPVVVEGSVTLEQKHNAIGTKTAPVSEVYVGSGCQYWKYGRYVPCRFNDATTNVWAQTAISNPTMRIPPVAWDYWYGRSSPGPRSPCTTSDGTPPVFDVREADGSLVRNNNVPGIFDLAPSSGSYTCKTRQGEISWDDGTGVLTVKGTVFIDGSALIEKAIVRYDAFSTVYLSGTLAIKNSTVCALLASRGSECDWDAWDPNETMLAFAASGTGGQLAADTSVEIVSSNFQGALYGTGAIDSRTTSRTQGPQVSEDEVRVGQTNEISFPRIAIAPTGMPGNDVPPPRLEDPEFG